MAYLLIGDGQGWEKFRELTATDGLKERISLAGRGPHDSLPEYTAAMDVALMLESNVYSSPLKVIEYIATGIPTVAHDMALLRKLSSRVEKVCYFPCATWKPRFTASLVFSPTPKCASK